MHLTNQFSWRATRMLAVRPALKALRQPEEARGETLLLTLLLWGRAASAFLTTVYAALRFRDRGFGFADLVGVTLGMAGNNQQNLDAVPGAKTRVFSGK